MSNPYKRLLGLLPRNALDVGTVTAVQADGVLVELVSGAVVQARGEAAIGSRVYVRGRVIEGPAPVLPVGEIEI